jgi:hypothetical protein
MEAWATHTRFQKAYKKIRMSFILIWQDPLISEWLNWKFLKHANPEL